MIWSRALKVALAIILVLLAGAAPQHAHQCRDVRLRLVEIISIDEKKVWCADLEEHRVGFDLVYEPDWAIFGAIEGDRKSLHITTIPFNKLKGRKGVLSYCGFCNRALSFAEWRDK